MSPPLNRVQAQGQGSVGADDFNTYVQWTNGVANLRAYVGLPGMVTTLLGYASPGDGGQGDFYWNATATGTDDGKDIIRPYGATVGAWIRLPASAEFNFTVLVPSGFDDTSLIAQASAAGPITLAGGNFIISGTLACANFVTMLGDTVLTTTGSATVNFNNGFTAPVGLAFGPGVTATFNPQFFSTGYPEWWGAVTNTTGTDCSTAINACIVACPITKLQAATYYTLSTVALSTPYRRVSGTVGAFPNPLTTISIQSSTLDAVLVGFVTQPGSQTLYLQGPELTDVFVTRTLPPTPPASGFGGPSGVRAQWLGGAGFKNVRCVEHTNGWWVKGAIYTTFTQIYAARKNAGSTTTNDYFAGLIFDDSGPPLGLNEDNASVYINQFGISGAGTAITGTNYGVYSIAGSTDFYLTQVETTGCQTGCQFNANGTDMYPSENLHCSNFSLDQVTNGILINGANKETAISIVQCQMVIAITGGNGQGITITNTPVSGVGGGITLVGNQIFGGGGTSTGIFVNNSTGVISRGNLIVDVNFPITVTTGGNCSFSDLITNPRITQNTFGAITLTACTRTVVDCTIYGAAGAFATGVDMVSTGNSYNEIRCSGIDPGCITGGSGNKLVSNGTQVTTAGTFSTNNLAQGILA